MALKVCFINPLGYPLFFPEDGGEHRFGGAEVQLYHLAVELARDKEFDVRTVVEAPRAGDLGEKESVRLQGVRPVSRLTERLRKRFPVLSSNYLRALLRADADVYVQRGGAVLTGEVGLFCRLRRRKFLFMSAHQWDCDRTYQRGPDRLCGRFYNFGVRSADRVLSQSATHRQLLLEHYGVESEVFNIVYPEDRFRAERKQGTVLWVGRCVDWKRPELFLDMAKEFPSVTFVMVCPHQGGSRSLYDEMERISRGLDNVAFKGRVPFAHINRYFGEAAVFVNTSVAEGFPNTFIQAACHGTPVVSLNVDPDGMLGREQIGFSCDDDTREAVARLRTLLFDDELRARYSENCRRYFLDNHLVSSHIAAFKKCLRSMAD